MKKFIMIIAVISIILTNGCKKEEEVKGQTLREAKEIDPEKEKSIYYRNQSPKNGYSKAGNISFIEFKNQLTYTNPNGNSYLGLQAFSGYSQKNDGKIQQSEVFFSISFDNITKPEIYYQEGTFRAIGYLQKIECIEFTDQFKDCKLYLKNNEVYDAEFKPEGEVLLKVKNDSLYLIIPLTFGTSDFLAYRNENGATSPESFESFKKAYKEYRKDKFAPPLMKFDYKEEDMKIYEE
ncbi:hypothetical protein [Leptospira sp. 'Mane']|uniref:hypothetical protein n=1 Tax=Leptospira sp. 'Mane' TaxID=3387407 RepID=UPI00398AEEBA